MRPFPRGELSPDHIPLFDEYGERAGSTLFFQKQKEQKFHKKREIPKTKSSVFYDDSTPQTKYAQHKLNKKGKQISKRDQNTKVNPIPAN